MQPGGCSRLQAATLQLGYSLQQALHLRARRPRRPRGRGTSAAATFARLATGSAAASTTAATLAAAAAAFCWPAEGWKKAVTLAGSCAWWLRAERRGAAAAGVAALLAGRLEACLGCCLVTAGCLVAARRLGAGAAASFCEREGSGVEEDQDKD